MADLFIPIDAKSAAPLYEQIYLYIREEIQAGTIGSGTKLPSSRGLSRLLGVSRSTVDLAYGQLVAEGYVESMPYRGYFACDISGMYTGEERQRNRTGTGDRCAENNPEKKHYAYDFTPYGLDLKSFPQTTWQKLSRDCLRDDKTELFRLGEPKGEFRLREELSRYLSRARNVEASPDQIVVGAGMEYLLMLLSLILGRESVVAMEDPSYSQAYHLFVNSGHRVRTIPVDQKGMDVDRLNETDASVAYVMPSHQYPTGVVMSAARRSDLLNWADRGRRYIIEDDYDSEFRYRGRLIPSLFSYDRGEKVIFLGTFSKSVAPAIRVAYMILPRPLLAVYEKMCGKMSSTVSRLDQMILTRFIRDGYFERHLNRMRKMYRNRHDVLLNTLRRELPECRISGENAGVHVLIHVRNEEEKALIDHAEKLNIHLYGINSFLLAKDRKHDREAVLLLGYANMNEEKIEEGVKALARIIHGYT